MSDTYAEVTIAVNNEQFIQIPIDVTGTVAQMQKLIEFETSIEIKDQVLIFEGKEVALAQQQQQQPQSQAATSQLRPMGGFGTSSQPRQQQQRGGQSMFGGGGGSAGARVMTAQQLIEHFKNNPMEFDTVLEKNPQFANAILSEDEPMITQYIEAIEKQRRLQELANDPFNEEGQKAIYEAIQQQNIEHNMEHAIEHTPEAFGRVIMLYVDSTINNRPIKAFVDTGAQQSIMTLKCAEKCGLVRLIDKRFHGIAKGVGTAKIVGRVHATNIKLGNSFFPIALSILDSPGQDTEFILGLDMLKRHQCLVNLRDNCLTIGEENVQFLAEKDLSEILNGDHELPENYVAPPANATTSGMISSPTSSTTSTTSTPTTPSPTTAKPSPSGSKPAPFNFGSPAAAPNEESINTLVSLGATREKAIDLLRRAGGDVERAASLFFGM
eukprot:gene14026-16531_t